MAEGQLEAFARKRPSISDVASEAGVSKAAVSKVIRNAYGVSPSMRERVEASIAKLGYRPSVAARAMRGSSFTIGFQIPNLHNDFFTQIVDGAASTLGASGYQLIIAPSLSDDSQASVFDALVDRQVDGLIAVSAMVTTEWLERLARDIPTVVLGRHDAALGYDTVNGDDRAGVGLVMDHLLGLGHVRIAHLTLRTPTDALPHAVRLAAYRDRMRAEGLPPHVVFIENSEQDAHQTAAALLESADRPTAIFAAHDTLAVGVLKTLGDLGLAARDVSVVGYDNVKLAEHPLIALTTVDQFGVEMGRSIGELLLERIRDGRTSPRHVLVTPELRVRRSTQAVESI